MTVTDHTTPAAAAPPVQCDSCQTLPASFVLRYPDTRFRVCAGCLAPGAERVAEPLDVDDELAEDPRPRPDREDPRW